MCPYFTPGSLFRLNVEDPALRARRRCCYVPQERGHGLNGTTTRLGAFGEDFWGRARAARPRSWLSPPRSPADTRFASRPPQSTPTDSFPSDATRDLYAVSARRPQNGRRYAGALRLREQLVLRRCRHADDDPRGRLSEKRRQRVDRGSLGRQLDLRSHLLRSQRAALRDRRGRRRSRRARAPGSTLARQAEDERLERGLGVEVDLRAFSLLLPPVRAWPAASLPPRGARSRSTAAARGGSPCRPRA